MSPDYHFIHKHRFHPGPVAIGGVGGSGTRLIAALLQGLGFYLGSDLNPANDNLAFTLLFKQSRLWPLEEQREPIRQSIRILLNALYYRQALTEQDRRHIHALADTARLNAPQDWLRTRAQRLIDAQTAGDPPSHWGWKEPNTHIFLPALLDSIPDLRYIHVMRHGLDMAYSVNQAQVKFWGEALTGLPTTHAGPEESFRYWCAAHRRVVATGRGMGANFLLLNFDDFCNQPRTGLQKLLQFLAIDLPQRVQPELLGMIRRPGSIGRHRERAPINPSAADLATLRELGFEH